MDKSHKAKPIKLPKTTYWPFFLAMGTIFIFWGIITTWVVWVVGIIVFSTALGGWITELYKELKNQKKEEK